MKANQIFSIFQEDPKRGAEYCGEIAQISIAFNDPEQAYVRARVAATFAEVYLERQEQAQ